MHMVYNKLVRDQIPEIIERSGRQYRMHVMEMPEYLSALDRKLSEELQEYLDSHAPEELADLMEVIYACALAQGVTADELEAIRMKKKQARGAFTRRLCLEEVWEQRGDNSGET